MSPQVTAAIIAASVGVLTVIATVAVQISGRRATSRDTQEALEEQRKQLDKTLAEQRSRTLNERFAAAAGQLGDDKPPAVRLAGVYAMAGLADDWPENRQTCIDVLCGYLRLPYEPDPGENVSRPDRLAFGASREVRHTVIRVITAHLQADMAEAKSWQGLDFDFTDVVFDGGSFAGAVFSGGMVSFSHAEFSGGTVSFRRARFPGGTVNFYAARFSGGTVNFNDARFSGGKVYFSHAEFSGGTVSFSGAEFSGGTDDPLSGVVFFRARFSGSRVNLGAVFAGGRVRFAGAVFSGGMVDFSRAPFLDGTVSFSRAEFVGGRVDFSTARFVGGTVDFADVGDWSSPPAFSWTDTPPSGVKLPGRTEPAEGGPPQPGLPRGA
jgi:uncharacterized protein YjbI with pentapeptide repeats